MFADFAYGRESFDSELSEDRAGLPAATVVFFIRHLQAC